MPLLLGSTHGALAFALRVKVYLLHGVDTFRFQNWAGDMGGITTDLGHIWFLLP